MFDHRRVCLPILFQRISSPCALLQGENGRIIAERAYPKDNRYELSSVVAGMVLDDLGKTRV
ncbi:MAG TPA: hypothetical protein VEI57_15270 [Nitrospirota bacterium]|nr:hypothetical protein [Nitrospirota bacterium]